MERRRRKESKESKENECGRGQGEEEYEMAGGEEQEEEEKMETEDGNQTSTRSHSTTTTTQTPATNLLSTSQREEFYAILRKKATSATNGSPGETGLNISGEKESADVTEMGEENAISADSGLGQMYSDHGETTHGPQLRDISNLNEDATRTRISEGKEVDQHDFKKTKGCLDAEETATAAN